MGQPQKPYRFSLTESISIGLVPATTRRPAEPDPRPLARALDPTSVEVVSGGVPPRGPGARPPGLASRRSLATRRYYAAAKRRRKSPAAGIRDADSQLGKHRLGHKRQVVEIGEVEHLQIDPLSACLPVGRKLVDRLLRRPGHAVAP